MGTLQLVGPLLAMQDFNSPKALLEGQQGGLSLAVAELHETQHYVSACFKSGQVNVYIFFLL